MAASVRIEDEAFSDRRYDLLARALGLPDADCARGKMAAIWRQCTQQQAHVLHADIVCVILGDSGIDALVKSRLGEVTSDGVRICGTRGRIEWLAKLRKNGRKGGRPRKPNGNHLVSGTETRSEPEPNPPAPAPAPAPAQIPEGEGEARSRHEPGKPALPPAPVPESTQPENVAPRAKRAAQRKAVTDPETEQSARRVLERLGKQNGVAYEGSESHIAKISARLREGSTEQQLRIVIAYCARPDGLGWADDPKMRKFLRPETLFGVETIARYRDPALSWYRALPIGEQVLGPLPDPAPLRATADDPLVGELVVEYEPIDLLSVIRGGAA